MTNSTNPNPPEFNNKINHERCILQGKQNIKGYYPPPGVAAPQQYIFQRSSLLQLPINANCNFIILMDYSFK